MSIKVGDKLPQATFRVMTADGPAAKTTDDLFKGKKVVLFSVPGAFTPTCSAKHLPSYVEKAAELRGEAGRALLRKVPGIGVWAGMRMRGIPGSLDSVGATLGAPTPGSPGSEASAGPTPAGKGGRSESAWGSRATAVSKSRWVAASTVRKRKPMPGRPSPDWPVVNWMMAAA